MLRVLILIAALVAGGAAAWVALRMQGEPSPVVTITQPAIPVPTQDVLVAAANLGVGQPLNKENMRWQSWPDSAVIAGFIVRSARPDALETLANSLVRSRMSAGEPIRAEKLVPTNAGYLSTLLPPGKRAVAVRISAGNSAGGFVLPNDRVDVLLTVGSTGKSDHSTRTILWNVPVLAIDQTVDGKSKDDKDENSKLKAGVIGKTATLELDPSQVEILTAGEATGAISLALRSASDNAERPPVPPPLPPLQSAQIINRFTFGSIQVVEIVKSQKPVDVPGPNKTLGPAWAPGQVMPMDLQQAKKDSSGIFLQ
jgi:pilus assembly protein CpaB